MTWLSLDYTLGVVALGAAAVGVLSGALGAFAVLRKQSLLGDAISHAALPGIALAFLVTHNSAPLVLAAGAVAAGWVATLLMIAIVRTTRIKEDASLGLVLSVFFGLGLMLLNYIQRHIPDAAQAGLDKLLFGQAAGLLIGDVLSLGALGGAALTALLVFWKEFKLLSFDPDFAASLGYPVRGLDIFLTTLTVVAIVLGLQTVGVVLMSAMLVAPAAAARQWTDRLGIMVALSATFGAAAGVVGTAVSHRLRTATGPVIVLVLGVLVLVSLALAPNRGLVWSRVRELRNRRRLRADTVLADLYALARQHDRLDHAHPAAVLRVMGAGAGTDRALRELASSGLARQEGGDRWALTPAGVAEAERRAVSP